MDRQEGRMKAVVFDMDGVLFDTEVLCMKSWMAVAKRNGLQRMEEVFPQCIGLNSNDSRSIVMKAYGDDFDYPGFREQAAAWQREYLEKYGLPIKPGLEEILGWLKTSGFSVVITGDMVEHSKPRPDIYLLACSQLGVKPQEAYAIEDSPNGVRSAHAAGMHTVMVPDMIPPDEEMKRLSRVILKDLLEVLDYLKARKE